MPKKIVCLLLFFVLVGVILPSTVQAIAGIYSACKGNIRADGRCQGATINVCYEGFVPCGLKKPYWENGSIGSNGKCQGTKMSNGVSCQLCHFFVMLNGIINFILIDIVPYLAILMIVIGGIMFYFGGGGLSEGGSPEFLARGKKLIRGVVIGLFLIYGAFMLVHTFLLVLGVSKASGLYEWSSKGFFTINCPVKIP